MSVHLAVLTPSYKNTVSTVYLNALLGFGLVPDWRFTYWSLPGDSLVSRVRNAMFAMYVQRRDQERFTHLMWLDDDIYVSGEHVKGLCESGLDVVGIPVPLKNTPNSHGIACAVNGAIESVTPTLTKVRHMGTGAVVLSNTAVDALVGHCEAMGATYMVPEMGLRVYDVFQIGAKDGFYRSEDWFMCDTLKGLGFDIYADSSGPAVHADGIRMFDRAPMPMDPRATSGRRDPLPEEERGNFWTPNDWTL